MSKSIGRLFRIKVATAWRLGLPSLSRFAAYRIGVKSGLNPVHRLSAAVPVGPFFRCPAPLHTASPAPSRWRDEVVYFDWRRFPLHGNSPDWHRNPFNTNRFPDPHRPWWQISDFDPAVGDIKVIWELSRFNWVLDHAIRTQSGDTHALERLNSWLADWLVHNPPYQGPNWKCGQESSIRVMHLAMAALVLGDWEHPTPGLLALVRLHLARIAPTLQYALAQDNNHGTSEAAALFIGGSWLSRQDPSDREVKRWRQCGRRWLEERTRHLILPDGSFSQYSVNYHRLLLDTLNMVTLWQQTVGEPAFSDRFREQAGLATLWLHAFTDPSTGDVPNLGANDGARLFPITETDYRDYRPTLQVAAALFLQKHAYPVAQCDEALDRLGISQPATPLAPPVARLFDQGGYAFLRRGNACVYMRYPRFRFRPSHGDALHLDFWLNGQNILRDGGSFSYAADAASRNYFTSVIGHNTIQFDDRDQMPRLGRFLYGAWLETQERTPLIGGEEQDSLTVAYRDWQGASHRRQIRLADDYLCVEDRIDGFREKAVLRWRLCPGRWQSTAHGWQGEGLDIRIDAEMPIVRMVLVEGWESRYYLQQTPLPIIEVEIAKPGAIRTQFSWTND